jgi:hypothetical protein
MDFGIKLALMVVQNSVYKWKNLLNVSIIAILDRLFQFDNCGYTYINE